MHGRFELVRDTNGDCSVVYLDGNGKLRETVATVSFAKILECLNAELAYTAKIVVQAAVKSPAPPVPVQPKSFRFAREAAVPVRKG